MNTEAIRLAITTDEPANFKILTTPGVLYEGCAIMEEGVVRVCTTGGAMVFIAPEHVVAIIDA